MKIKVIGLGNRIMMDDGLAIHVLDQLTGWLNGQQIEVVIGETDSIGCLNQINEEDFLILMDATHYNLVPGTITQQDLAKIKPRYKTYSQHDMSLIDLFHRYGLRNKGFLIGIEIAEVGFGIDLSEELKPKLGVIVEKVKNLMKEIMEEYGDA